MSYGIYAFVTAVLFSVLIGEAANAQSLPNMQKVSLRAPADLKIDGKATEWGGKLQAYNTNTDIFYTLANDDENFYLTVKADRPRIIEKIIAVGITLTVNNKGQRSYKATESRAITFPVIEVKYGQAILSAMRIKTINVAPSRRIKDDPFYTSAQQDSLTTLANGFLTANSKSIKIKGIDQISDTSISVYNEDHIKVAQIFNSGTYTYELAVPLKYLGLSMGGTKKFAYSIKLASRLDEGKKGTMMVYKYDRGGEPYNANQDLDSATDFWGDYTLAKK